MKKLAFLDHPGDSKNPNTKNFPCAFLIRVVSCLVTMMKIYTRSLLLFILAIPLLVWMACSDPQNAPTSVDNEVSVHAPGWMDQASPNFHGTALGQKNYDAGDCRQCHGNNFAGGTSDVSCRTCHASYPYPANFSNGHTSYVKGTNYDLNSCQSCHGKDYSLKKIDKSCLTCHTQANGPEACNTCHGNFSASAADLKNSAPPKGLDDETNSTAPTVGAHQAHFAYFNNLTTGTVCQECHKLPQDFEAPGHIADDARAENIFGPLATLKTESGARVPNVTYDFTNNTCANSYCHGNWGLLKSRPNNPNEFIYIADK